MIRILRNMGRRRVRTGLTMFGIALGVYALAVMGALGEAASSLEGADLILANRTITVFPASQAVEDKLTQGTLTQLRQVDGVRAVGLVIGASLNDVPSAVNIGPPEQVTAIDPAFQHDVFRTETLQAGRWLEPGDTRSIVMGSASAAKRHLTIGSTFMWRKQEYTIVGIMAQTNSYPDVSTIMPFETARRDLLLPTTYLGSTVLAFPTATADPEAVARRIDAEVPRVLAKSPQIAAKDIHESLGVFSGIVLACAALAAVVGGLAVVNTMIMSVNERTREIGIKKAVGADDWTIVREFIAEAALIGLLSGAAGLWAGWATTVLLNTTVAPMFSAAEVWRLTPTLALNALMFAVGLAVLAGVYPAWSAARLDPVQALRAD